MSRIPRSKSSSADFAKECPHDCFRFNSSKYSFGPQQCRVYNHRRPTSLEPFVSGNFQFIYKNCEQLSLTQNSATKLTDLNDVLFSHSFFTETGVQWELLYAAIAHVSDDYVCPICFFTPVAPRLTPCGHILCADCLDQLYKAEEKPLCPICSESLAKGKSIRCKCTFHPNTKDIGFMKIFKNTSNNIVFPAHGNSDVLRTASDPLARFMRFGIADSRFCNSLRKSELESLELQLITYAEYDCPGKIKSINKIKSIVEAEPILNDHTDFYIGSNSDKTICFFQAEDGRLIFLDELNIKLLSLEFGSLEKAPDIFKTKIIGTTNLTIDLSNRSSRLEFSHLPIGAEVTLAFVDLAGVISPELIKEYAVEIKANTPKEVKPKPACKCKRVITIDDYQKFQPMEPEPEVNMNSEEAFPTLGAPKTKSKPKVEEFPTLESLSSMATSKPKPQPKSAWGLLNL